MTTHTCMRTRTSTGGLTAEGIAWAFTTSHASNWHPLTWLSHMLDCQLYGLKPGGHHLTNVLLHAATAILLFLVLRRMTGDLWPSAFVAAVFAIHPLRVESVAWVAERKDVLSGLFFMLTLGAYVGYVRRPFSLVRYLTVVVLFALGLMAKPMLVTLPFVLLLLDYWPLGRMAAGGGGQVRRFPGALVVEKIPLLALAAASCVATSLAQSKAVVPIDVMPLSSRIANALVSYVAYLGQILLPGGAGGVLSPSGQTVCRSGKSSRFCLGVDGHLGSGPGMAAAVSLSVCRLVLVRGDARAGDRAGAGGIAGDGRPLHLLAADRAVHRPGLGSCATRRFLARIVAGCAASASALVVLILMGCAWRQTSYWRDSETLWTRALACTAETTIAHNNLGNVLAERGQFDAAIAHYQKALEIKPDYARRTTTSVLPWQVMDRSTRPSPIIGRRWKSSPTMRRPTTTLVALWRGRGQFDEAIAHYQKALEIKPDIRARPTTTSAMRLWPRRADRSTRPSPIIGRHWKSSPTTRRPTTISVLPGRAADGSMRPLPIFRRRWKSSLTTPMSAITSTCF